MNWKTGIWVSADLAMDPDGKLAILVAVHEDQRDQTRVVEVGFKNLGFLVFNNLKCPNFSLKRFFTYCVTNLIK